MFKALVNAVTPDSKLDTIPKEMRTLKYEHEKDTPKNMMDDVVERMRQGATAPR
jgi:hypothetical protein